MGGVFYREPKADYPVAIGGDGVFLRDRNGKEYLDASGGAAVSSLGHGNRYVIEAIQKQLDQLAFAHTSFFTNEPQENLARRLSERFWEPGSKVYFLSGGSEANETAIKLARQYHLAKGNQDKHIIISRRGSYHGSTMGALSLSGTPKQGGFAPLLHAWPKISPCYAYREQAPGETIEAYAKRAADELEIAIEMTGPSNVAAFIAEPVVGATLGAVEAVPGYLQAIRAICDKHDVLLISDEVMCGSGRCGPFFASSEDDAKPDIITLGKGIGGGYQPLGAAIARQKIHDAIVDAFGAFAHGHSYVGHAAACAAGCAVLDVHEQDDLLPGVKDKGARLKSALSDRLADYPFVGDIRGRGLLLGIECVEDRDTRQPLSADREFARRTKAAAMDRGLICYPFGGALAGGAGGHILLAPPFIVTDEHIELIADRISGILMSVFDC